MLSPPENVQLARIPGGEPPVLVVVVDTEEEFDWAGDFSRGHTSVGAMEHIDRAQSLCDEFGVKPCYVVDYPVVTQERSLKPLQAIFEKDRCSIGAHLHPWVNPPHEEEVSSYNSYPGNLPMLLEKAKLAALNKRIESAFGSPATVYKAGRYGVGANTYGILQDMGFEVDLSLLPAFDLSADGGPDFQAFPPHPWWFGAQGQLLCLPGTAGLVGLLGRHSPACYRLASRPVPSRARLPGVLARLGLVERIQLSPEGYTLEEMKRLTRYLFDRGVRIYALSFHSPSVVPGLTPYVSTDTELSEFLRRLREYFRFFFETLGGRTMSPLDVRSYLLDMRS